MGTSTVFGNISSAITLMEFLKTSIISDRKQFEIFLKKTITTVCDHIRRSLLTSSEYKDTLPKEVDKVIIDHLLSEINSGHSLSPDTMCENLYTVPECIRLALSREIHYSLNASYAFCQNNSLFKLIEDMEGIKDSLHTAEELLCEIKNYSYLTKQQEPLVNDGSAVSYGMHDKVKAFANNQKDAFVAKWNAELFLHKDTGVKLCSLYEKPSFLLNSKKCFDIDKVFNKFLVDNSKNVMIVLGNPGLGKSSLMSYWANEYEKYDNYIFVKMYELEPSKAKTSLLDAIVDYLECKNRDLRDKVLFLDGYDELRVDNKHYELCLKLISEIQSVFGLKVVISSRLNYIDLDKDQYEEDFNNVNTIVLLPFTKKQMIRFMREYDKAVHNTDERKIKQFLNNSTEKEIFGIPFILYLVCALNLDITRIQNVFSLYDRVFAFNGGIYDKIYDKFSGHYLTRNPQTKRELLSVSKLFALEMFKNNSSIEISKVTAEFILNSYCPERKADFAIGNYYNIEANRIMFVHKTFGEYFFCKYLVEFLENIPNLDNQQVMFQLWDIFQQNYMYKRLENLLELAVIENSKIKGARFAERMEDCCQYIMNHFEVLPNSNDGILEFYHKLQNYLTSVCKIFKLTIGKGWVKHVDLNDAFWSFILKNKGYCRIDLEYLHLENADISGTVLRGNLTSSNFNSCNLCRIDLRGCNAEKCFWESCDIKLAYASKIKLNASTWKRCKCHQSNFERAEFINSDMTEVQFRGAVLKSAVFRGAKMVRVDFSDADLSNADFRGATFCEVIFNGAKMDGAIFDEDGLT